MKILMVLNYYYPYISGVSEYARVLSEEFVSRGCECTVLCSNHNKLPQTEIINGVSVIRAPIIMKISKGTVSPKFISLAKKLSKDADIVCMHLPMLESGVISRHIPREKLFPIYQCDVNLPKGVLNSFIVSTMDRQHRKCLSRANKVLVTTVDYALSSRVAKDFSDKLLEIRAPIKTVPSCKKETNEKKVIGFCGRIVEEKGIDVLLAAYKILKEKREDICLRIGGDYKNVAGGSVYPALSTYIKENNLRDVEFIGMIPEAEMGAFYSGLDVFTLPSVNSLEAFGLVQIEAMMCGAPVVASDLPGVRTIVQNTGMGLVCKRGNAEDLAACIDKILDSPDDYKKSPDFISDIYSTRVCVDTIYQIFKNATEKTENIN